MLAAMVLEVGDNLLVALVVVGVAFALLHRS